jgi:hypothetical protein
MLNKADLAKEAERLLKDQYLEYALDAIRKDTCEALLTADAADTNQIIRLQARAAIVDEIRNQLETYIQDMKVTERRGFA